MKKVCGFVSYGREDQAELTDVIVNNYNTEIVVQLPRNDVNTAYCLPLLRNAIEIDSAAGTIALINRTVGITVSKTEIIFLPAIIGAHLFFNLSEMYTICALGAVALIPKLDPGAIGCTLRLILEEFANRLSYNTIRAEIIALISALTAYVALSSATISLVPLALSALALELGTKGDYVIHAISTYASLCVGLGATITDMPLYLEIALRIATAVIVLSGLQLTSEGLKSQVSFCLSLQIQISLYQRHKNN